MAFVLYFMNFFATVKPQQHCQDRGFQRRSARKKVAKQLRSAFGVLLMQSLIGVKRSELHAHITTKHVCMQYRYTHTHIYIILYLYLPLSLYLSIYIYKRMIMNVLYNATYTYNVFFGLLAGDMMATMMYCRVTLECSGSTWLFKEFKLEDCRNLETS